MLPIIPIVPILTLHPASARRYSAPFRMQHFAIGLAGMGNVGAGVFKHLVQNRALLRERLGFELEVKKVALRDPKKDRGVAIPPELVTSRWQDILEDPSIQIVV